MEIAGHSGKDSSYPQICDLKVHAPLEVNRLLKENVETICDQRGPEVANEQPF